MIQKIITEIQQEVDKLDVTDPTQNGIAEGLLTAKRIAEKAVQKPKLSDLVKTECFIDCGTHNKARELAALLTSFGISPASFQLLIGVLPDETVLYVGKDRLFHSMNSLDTPDGIFPSNYYKLEDIELC